MVTWILTGLYGEPLGPEPAIMDVQACFIVHCPTLEPRAIRLADYKFCGCWVLAK